MAAPKRVRVPVQEETDRSARWRTLRPGTLAGLAVRSPEGTEERWAQCNAVYTVLPQGACDSHVHLVSKAGSVIGSKSPAFKWSGSKYTEPYIDKLGNFNKPNAINLRL